MIRGIVCFMLANVGSKSEGMRPFLYLGNGEYKQVWMDGDESMNGEALLEFDSKTVLAQGEEDSNGIFCIRDIKLPSDVDAST